MCWKGAGAYCDAERQAASQSGIIYSTHHIGESGRYA